MHVMCLEVVCSKARADNECS